MYLKTSDIRLQFLKTDMSCRASMLGVMTLNAGYIIALLVRVFAGELVFGRQRPSAAY
jgi:hypothetical protein